MGKPKKSRKEAQTQHEAMQTMGLSPYATKKTQQTSKEHQKAKFFFNCPACKRINKKYDITD